MKRIFELLVGIPMAVIFWLAASADEQARAEAKRKREADQANKPE